MTSYLLDTHTLLWWLDGDKQLSANSKKIIASEKNQIYVSAASAWEICIKVRIGKLPGAVDVSLYLPEILEQQSFLSLSISVQHARIAGLLPGQHRDPFDRILAAQASENKLTVISNDKLLDLFGINRSW